MTSSWLASSETYHEEALQKIQDEHLAKVTRLKEEIKRLEPLESRAKVLNKEVTKLMADIQASKQKTATTEQMEKDTKVAQQDIDDQLKQWEEEMAEERCAIEEDLLKQFEAGFKKAKTLYHHLFTNLKLDFDQVSP